MRTWVTVDDYLVWTGAGPYTDADLAAIRQCCDAVSAYIVRVRPDLAPPAAVLEVSSQRWFSAFDGEVDAGRAGARPHSLISYAALQLVRRWWEKRGDSGASAFQEVGFIPSSLDRDIEEMLQIGRSYAPVIA